MVNTQNVFVFYLLILLCHLSNYSFASNFDQEQFFEGSNQHSPAPIMDLPNEVLEYVISLAVEKPEDCESMKMVNKRFHALVDNVAKRKFFDKPYRIDKKRFIVPSDDKESFPISIRKCLQHLKGHNHKSIEVELPPLLLEKFIEEMSHIENIYEVIFSSVTTENCCKSYQKDELKTLCKIFEFGALDDEAGFNDEKISLIKEKFPNLTRLTINGYDLRPYSKDLVMNIKKNHAHSLKLLGLSNAIISPDGVEYLANIIKDFTVLELLNLNGTILDNKFINLLIKNLPSTLKSLQLGYTNLQKNNIETLIEKFPTLDYLTELNLDAAGFKEPETIQKLFKKLPDNLIKLSLRHVDLNQLVLDSFPKRNFSNLKFLDLSLNPLEKYTLENLKPVLLSPNLETLKVKQCSLRSGEITVLKRIFQGMNKLKMLDISENTYIQDAMQLQYLTGFFCNSTERKKLIVKSIFNIFYYVIPSGIYQRILGAYPPDWDEVILDELLKSLPRSLETLNLNWSSLHSKHVGIILSYLLQSENLKNISLERNHLENEGVFTFLENLKDLPKIQSLNLKHNYLRLHERTKIEKKYKFEKGVKVEY